MLWRQKLSHINSSFYKKKNLILIYYLVRVFFKFYLEKSRNILSIIFFFCLTHFCSTKTSNRFNLIMSVPPPHDVIIIAIIVYTDPETVSWSRFWPNTSPVTINHGAPPPAPSTGQASGGQMPVIGIRDHWDTGSGGPCTVSFER